MRAVPLAIGLLLAACKPTATTRPPSDGDTPVSSGDASDPSATAPDDVPPSCAADGHPWDGKPSGCLYEHGGCCYGSPESACAAAGCSAAACRILESHPAQVQCSAADS